MLEDFVKVNFKTPCGLKVRLNHRYFFYQLTKTNKFCTNDEIVDNDTMFNAVKNIESTYILPTALIQAFSIVAIMFHISIIGFWISSAVLYLFGCIWRCFRQGFLLDAILLFIAATYKKLWWLFYIALIVLTFVFDSTYLVFPYVIIRITCCLAGVLQNHLILNITHKKYEIPFNDTELCAFRTFYRLSKSNLKFSDYIQNYVLENC